MASDYGMLSFVIQLSHQKKWKYWDEKITFKTLKGLKDTRELQANFWMKTSNREVIEQLDIRTKAACSPKAFVSATYLNFRVFMGKRDRSQGS